jgi:hypothetical protein
MISRTFDGDIPFCFSLFVVRLRDEAASASTDGILIVEFSRDETVGQPTRAYFSLRSLRRKDIKTREAIDGPKADSKGASPARLYDGRRGSHADYLIVASLD